MRQSLTFESVPGAPGSRYPLRDPENARTYRKSVLEVS